MPAASAVIISQSSSRDPARRGLEEAVAAALSRATEAPVLVVPPLYDLPADGPNATALRRLPGDLIVLAWYYPRATHWVLHRLGIRGRIGQASRAGATSRADSVAQIAERSMPAPGGDAEYRLADRTISCFDLRQADTAETLLAEIQPLLHALGRAPAVPPPPITRIEEPVRRRWYPVIDYQRCTHCLECIDFCLFGVYGLDHAEAILVEQPDNCRQGCPACSRVCPEQAILFPQHKTPAIAGGEGEIAAGRIDLSELFGGPGGARGTAETAVRERAEQIALSPPPPARGGPDTEAELDRLVDQLDELDP